MHDDRTFSEPAARFWHPVARSADVGAGAVVGGRCRRSALRALGFGEIQT